MSQKEKIKEITESLEQGIKDLFQSENYKNYLKVMSRFSSYSFNNSLLIAMQMPTATAVAGYRKWQTDFERNVKKGEKTIKIIAPCPYKVDVEKKVLDPDGRPVIDSNGKEVSEKLEKELLGFRVANVFDVSQTEGKELPSIAHKLDGNMENYNDIMAAIKNVSPVPIEFSKVPGNANGYYDLGNKKIVIDLNMSEQMNIRVAVHELAHALLHDKETGTQKDAQPNRQTKEVQAESVSFTVSEYLGLDTRAGNYLN